MPAMSAYESKVWAELHRREAEVVKPRGKLAERAVELRDKASVRTRKIADKSPEAVKNAAVTAGDGFRKALGGISWATVQTAAATLSEQQDCKAFAKARSPCGCTTPGRLLLRCPPDLPRCSCRSRDL